MSVKIRKELKAKLGDCIVSYATVNTIYVSCKPESAKACIEYLEDAGYSKIVFRHPCMRDEIKCDLTKMIITAEQRIC